MPKNYYKSVSRAMNDQYNRNYGRNKHGDYTFTGRDPHGRSTNSSFRKTFRDPLSRSRKSSATLPKTNKFGNAPLGINIHAKSNESSKAQVSNAEDRTTHQAYGDAIRIRFLESENKSLKSENDELRCEAMKAVDNKEELKDEIMLLRSKLEKSEDDQMRLINLIGKNPCTLSNGSWTLEIGGMVFRSEKQFEKGEL